jgi:hypothetical protein
LRSPGAIIHADHDGNHIRLETSDAPFERSQNAISLVTADAGIDDDVLDAPQFPADALGEVLDVTAAAVGMLGAVGDAIAREDSGEGTGLVREQSADSVQGLGLARRGRGQVGGCGLARRDPNHEEDRSAAGWQMQPGKENCQ